MQRVGELKGIRTTRVIWTTAIISAPDDRREILDIWRHSQPNVRHPRKMWWSGTHFQSLHPQSDEKKVSKKINGFSSFRVIWPLDRRGYPIIVKLRMFQNQNQLIFQINRPKPCLNAFLAQLFEYPNGPAEKFPFGNMDHLPFWNMDRSILP